MCASTDFATQQRRDDDFPSDHLLATRTRLHESTIPGSQKMRNCTDEVRSLFYYKQQKYDSVNTLARFCAFIVLIMTFSVCMQAFSLSSTKWLRIRYDAQEYNTGLFVSCVTSIAYRCTDYHHTGQTLSIFDTVTQLEVCSMSSSFVRGHIGGMWTVAIVQLTCQTLFVILIIYLLWHPTRSVLVLWVMSLLILSICCGIINTAVFTRFTHCYRQTCRARHEGAPFCTVGFQWAYGTYIASIVLNSLCFIVALCMYSYTYAIRYRTARMLSKIRRFQCATPCERFNDNQRRAIAMELSCIECDSSRTRTSTTRSSFCSCFAPSSPPMNFTARNIVSESDRATDRVIIDMDQDERIRCIHQVRASTGGKNVMEKGALLPVVDEQCRDVNCDQSARPCYLSVRDDNRCTRERHINSLDISTSRYMRDVLAKLFSCTNKSALLTAKELNININGADDWAYDDHSDMFYSFELNSFWDPLICAYYNCMTRTWHSHVSDIVDMHTLS